MEETGGDGGQRTDEGMEVIPSHSWRKSRAETSKSSAELGEGFVPTDVPCDHEAPTFRRVDGLDRFLHEIIVLGEEVRKVLEESEVSG